MSERLKKTRSWGVIQAVRNFNFVGMKRKFSLRLLFLSWVIFHLIYIHKRRNKIDNKRYLLGHSLMPSSDPSSQSSSPSQTYDIGMHFLLAQANCLIEQATASGKKENHEKLRDFLLKSKLTNHGGLTGKYGASDIITLETPFFSNKLLRTKTQKGG